MYTVRKISTHAVPGEYESRDGEVSQHRQWTLATNGISQLIDIQANVKNGLE